MADILIRDVPEATVLDIDRRARAAGLSRSEYLRRNLNRTVGTSPQVSVDDLHRFSWLARDLADPDVMRDAWS